MSEYTSWGFFVKSWGWDVAPEGTPGDTVSDELEICAPAEPESAPPPSLCQSGLRGPGPGQMGLLAGGIAVDNAGNVWVGDFENLRVQKFSPAGEFLLMLGGDVNDTKAEGGGAPDERNVCPIAPTDVCQAGTMGGGPSQLPGTLGDVIAYHPTLNAIAVGDKDRIQIFNLNGTFQKEIRFEGGLAAFDEETVVALDVDTAGNVYIALSGLPDIYKLSDLGAPLAPGEPSGSKFEVPEPLAVAVDATNSVYGVEASSGDPGGRYILGFDLTGNPIDGMRPPDKFAAPEIEAFPEFAGNFANDLIGIASNLCSGSAGPNLYAVRANLFGEGARSYVSAYGSPPVGCEAPPKRPPVIEDQYATSVGTDKGVVKARINPRFWPDTLYYVEYGIGRCSTGGCDSRLPLAPGAVLTESVVNASLATVGVALVGLEPGTVYHFRFVAESTGGGPVHGLDPDGKGPQQASSEDGLEGTFRTFPAPDSPKSCVNDAVRGGAAASLPDCRAYELVSPLEKGGADVGLLREERFWEVNQAAMGGDRFTFSAMSSFLNPQGAPYVSQYLAERDPDAGWASEAISPSHTTTPLDANSGLNNEFKAFSSDLCLAWLRHNSSSRLTADAVPGFPNIYRRDNCVDPPAYESLTTVEPPKRSASEYGELALKGFSDDGSHVLYAVDDELHPDAPSLDARELLLYERVGGEMRFVCYLPNGKPSPQACSAGAPGSSGPDFSTLSNAISADGSHIFWTAYSGPSPSKFAHPGRIFVRIDGEESVAVSGSVTSEPAFFWTAADDGSKAIFEVMEGPLKGNLYEFDLASRVANLIAKEVEGPMGASEDASRIYFASTADLDGAGPAIADDHNLYFYDAASPGTRTFVMALADDDFGAFAVTVVGPPRPIHRQPAGRGATVSPDGLRAAFMSTASPTPTGYDNRDAVSGGANAEVYRYDAAVGELLCVSCNPTGARPMGANLNLVSVAARLRSWEMNFHAPRVLSHDGSRVFFESHEALVPRDTNGRWDVYQWEEPGKGTCEEGVATFHKANGGCLDLISSGESAADSMFLDADPFGDNVFIGTQSSLVGADHGLNDVYVARVGGGFPEPAPPVECEGEACATPRSAPPELTPASGTEKPGNPVRKARRCSKGKKKVRRKGRAVCIKRKKSVRRRGTARRQGAGR